MILALLIAAAVAWWSWGRGLSRNQLVAIGSALAGVWLLTRGSWQLAVPMFLPGIWLLVQNGRQRPPPAPTMDVDEARRVLGVARDADADSIRAAHRRLVARVHPDHGGSAELAGKVNAARDILLAEQGRRYPR